MHIGHDFLTEYFMGGDDGMEFNLKEIVIGEDLGVNITNSGFNPVNNAAKQQERRDHC
jgi:hypothetical protein